jgi:hypothetical protein
LASFLLFSRNDFNIIDQSKNPFRKLLGIWIDLYADANFSKLLKSLRIIQRFDVHDDVIELLGLLHSLRLNIKSLMYLNVTAIDAQNYLEKKNVQNLSSLIPEASLLPETAVIKAVPTTALPQRTVNPPTIKTDPDNNIITKQDYLNRQPQLYDAFVLYDEGDSTHMPNIQEIVNRLEKMNFTVI